MKDFETVLQEYRTIYKNNKMKIKIGIKILLILLILSSVVLTIFVIANMLGCVTKNVLLGEIISCSAVGLFAFIIIFVDKRNWHGRAAHRKTREKDRILQFSDWLKKEEYDSKEKIEYLIYFTDKQFEKKYSLPYLPLLYAAAIPILINLFTAEERLKLAALSVALGFIIVCIILCVDDYIRNKPWITVQMQDDLVYIKTFYR